MSNRLPPAGSGNRRTVGSMNSAGETPGGSTRDSPRRDAPRNQRRWHDRIFVATPA